MLKQFTWKKKFLLFLAIFLLLSISIISIKTNIVKGQGRLIPSLLPIDVQSTNDATPTPDATEQAENLKTVYPTPTEIPISKYTDLSPSLNDQDKFIIKVRHSDGTYEQFTVGPLRSFIVLIKELPDYIIAKIPLQPGDEIIGWLPPANPYRAMPTASATPIQPTPIYPTEIPPTQRSYP